MNNELNLPFCSHKKFSVFRHFFDRHFDDISKPRMSDMSQMSALKNKIDIFDIDISPVGYVLTTLLFIPPFVNSLSHQVHIILLGSTTASTTTHMSFFYYTGMRSNASVKTFLNQS